MESLRIVEADPAEEPVARLIGYHVEQMHRWSPPASVHALPANRLREDDVTFYAAWHDGRLAGCGALKQLEADHGELKSMRVAPEFLRRGIGEAILLRLLGEARARGYSRVSLETGDGEPFVPALRLYAKHGFTRCEPFAGYTDDGFSQCLSKAL